MDWPKNLATRKGSLWIYGGVLIVLGLIGAAFWHFQPLMPRPLDLPAGSSISAQTTLATPGPYRIGDPLQLTVAVRATKGVQYQLPRLSKQALGKLELKNQTGPQTLHYWGGSGQMTRYTLVAWETGEFTVPALHFTYRLPGGKSAQYTLPTRTIRISSVLPKGRTQAELLSLPLKPVKPPVNLPPTYRPLWVILAVMAAMLAIYGAYFWWRKTRPCPTAEAIAAPVVREPAHVIALRRLEVLHQQAYLAEGQFAAYYTELSECLREYMENRFQINALEMTTEEFLNFLSGDQVLTTDCRSILQRFLQASDLVKFAKYIPDQSAATDSWEQIRQLIEQTIPEADVAASPLADQRDSA